MRNDILKRIAAAVMAGTMVIGMGTGVFAEGDSVPQNATITKEITKEAYDYAPATTFSFAIRPAQGSELTAGTTDTVYAGPTGATIGTIASLPNTTDIGQETITAGTTQVDFSSVVFPAPGSYRYVVTETAGNYEGLEYTDEAKYFDVYVTYDKESNSNQITSYAFVNPQNAKEKDDGVFTNDYDTENEPLYDVVIEKEVTGNQGDRNKAFNFLVGVDGATNENFYVVITRQGGTTDTLTLISDADPTQITLKDGESAKIYGLSETDEYTVTETDYSSDGYTTTIDNTKTNTKTSTISTDTTVTVENNKNVTTPTGIIMNFAPYILMIGAGVVLTVVFFGRKRYFER